MLLLAVSAISRARSFASDVVWVIVAFSLVAASVAAVAIVLDAWRDTRQRRIVVEDVIDASGSEGVAQCALLGHRLQSVLAREVVKASRRLETLLDHEARAGDEMALQFHSDAWQQTADELSAALAEPKDLLNQDLTLVQSLAPEDARPAVSLLMARVIRPQGMRVGLSLVGDGGARVGLAITISDLRGRLARRRHLLWTQRDAGTVEALVALAARYIAVEAVRSDLLAQAPRQRWRGDPSAQLVHYVAVTRYLCGRLFFGSARNFPEYTMQALRRAVDEYEGAFELEESYRRTTAHPNSREPVDIKSEPIIFWRALAEGEMARRMTGRDAVDLYDTALDHLRLALARGARLERRISRRWEITETTLMLLRAQCSPAPSSTAALHQRLGSTRDSLSTLLADEGAAYECACLFSLVVGTQWEQDGDEDRACVALGVAVLQAEETLLSATQDLDLELLRRNGWVHHLAVVVVPQRRLDVEMAGRVVATPDNPSARDVRSRDAVRAAEEAVRAWYMAFRATVTSSD